MRLPVMVSPENSKRFPSPRGWHQPRARHHKPTHTCG